MSRLTKWLNWLLATSFMTVLVYSPAQAEEEKVYTWEDASGRVHYSNRRPKGQSAETVELNTKPVVVQPTENIYTWIDGQGKVHYGAKPPADLPAKKLQEDDSTLSTVPFDPPSTSEGVLLPPSSPLRVK